MIDSTDTIDLSAVDTDALTTELRRRMHASAAVCPEFCDVTHTTAQLRDGSYHHDGGAEHISLSPESISSEMTSAVRVKLALFVPGADDGRVYRPQIEIQIDESTVLELAQDDAAELAGAILSRVALIG